MNQADSLMTIVLMLWKVVLTSVLGAPWGAYRCPPAGTGQEMLREALRASLGAFLVRLVSRSILATASIDNKA